MRGIERERDKWVVIGIRRKKDRRRKGKGGYKG